MKPLIQNHLAAISFISLGLINSGCGFSSHTDKEKKITSFTKASSSLERDFSFLENFRLEEQQEEEDLKLFEFELKYEDYEVKIEKEDRTVNPWKLYATIFIDQKPHKISLVENSLDKLEENLSQEIINRKTDDIIELEKTFEISIKTIEKNGKNEFKVTDNNTGESDLFKNLNDIKIVYTGIESSSAYIAKKAKTIKYAIRALRGKDVHNKVLNLKTQDAGKALVIDGFDDLASALENSGLPKHLELSLKSSIYMIFGGAVFIGYEGANEEFQETKNEYSESIEETKLLRKEIISNMENEIAAKEILLKSIGVTDAALSDNDKIARNIAMENARFKIEFAKEILKSLNKKKVQTSLNSKIFPKLLELVQNHNKNINNLKNQTNGNIRLNNPRYTELFEKLKSTDSIKSINSINSLSTQDQIQDYVVSSINSLFEYQNNLNNSLSKSIESTSILPNISRGLSSMYYGMIAFEAKTLSELLTLKSTTETAGIANSLAFQNYLTSVEAIGNGFLAAGQAQMVIAGLSKISDNASELKSLNSWIEDMIKSPFWDAVNKSSNLDNDSKKNILKTKKILESFYKSKRNWIRARATGDAMLTAGQAAMFVSGPLVLGVPALSGFGAGSTILGIVASQMSDQYIEKNFEFDQPEEDSLEAKISKGEQDNTDDSFTTKLLDRSAKLVDLSIRKTQVRVWQKIYDALILNPNIQSKELIKNLKESWKSKDSKINAAKKEYYSEIYLENLNNIFPENNESIFNKNIEFINEAKLLLNNNTDGTQNLKSLQFIQFISTHLRHLNSNIETSQNVYSPVLLEQVKLSSLNNQKSPEMIKSIFTFFDEFGLTGEFERRIVKKIVLQNGFPFAKEDSVSNKIKIASRYLKEVKVKTNKQPWNIPNPLPGFFVYYFPQLSGNSEKPSKPLIFSKKDKSIYVFDRKLYLEDIEKYDSLEQSVKNSVDEFSKLAFEADDFNNSIDNGFFNKLKKLKGAFGKEIRSAFKLTYESIAKNTFRTNALRPLFNGVADQISQYNNLNNIFANNKKFTRANIAKYSYAGIEKFSSAANKYNVGMNFILMPQSLSNIHQSVQEGAVLDATRGALSFSFNNADLAFDLARNVGGNTFWIKHPKSFQGIGSVQIVLNVASAGLDIWQAVELFKAAEITNNQSLKTDLYVNASLTTATAATSLGTALLLPLSAKAGPIGAAIGFTIMFTQGTYNAVRTSEQLRELGFSEEEVVLNSIANFFGKYSTGEDPKFLVKKTAKEMEETTIPEIMTLNNKEFLQNIGKNKLNNSFYFNKIVYPRIHLYVPYTAGQTSLYCAYGICNSVTTQIPKPIEENKHMCLTNNTYFSNDADRNSIFNDHMSFIKNHHRRLAKKATPIPAVAKGTSFGAHGGTNYYNSTTPCPSVSINYPMVEQYAIQNEEEKLKLKNIPASQKANLYFVGIGDQGKHGNMISSIVADKNYKNLFNIHPSSFILQLVGGDKEDVFEFYDYVQGIFEGAQTNGFIDGGAGIDTINLQGIPLKNEKIYISLNSNSIKSNQFLEIKNVERVIGSQNDDEIIGNELNNELFGNEGNDSLEGREGNDILYPGKGNDYLKGGSGNDVYVILKKDVSNSTIKTINNFDESAAGDFQNNYDAIMTDIEDLTSQKDNLDLLLGVHENNSFVEYIRIQHYFLNKKFQHIVLSDTKGNVYTTLNGTLYNNQKSSAEIYTPNYINTINLKGKSPITKMAQKEFKDKFNLNFKNVIGTNGNDVIFGDEQNNFINGQKGLDFIKGNDGDDTLTVFLDPQEQTENVVEVNKTLNNYITGNYDEFIRLEGGRDHDSYIINLPNFSYVNNAKPIFIEINNRDKFEKIDSLIVNDSRNTFSNIYFTKISDLNEKNQHLKINLFDSVEEKNYIFILKNWFNNKKNQHLQIQFGDKLSIPQSILQIVTDSLKKYTLNKINKNLKESDTYEFTINDRYIALNQRLIEVKQNSYNVIESNILPHKENEIDFKYEIINNSHSGQNKHRIKFARFENDLIIQFEAKSELDNSSFTVLKNYFQSEKYMNKNFKIKINSEEYINNEEFKLLNNNLSETDVIKMEV
ncbi:calcium-binding protein [Fluviispira multicolorata]|uniref:Uncharacterized protein n=1 Tax=Fluviispira multicolorata TaxID=2654512 RepID=A0A833JCJ7_9BACT|nr:calcium-binding protein [Fluviispira multicolorata]KAB8029845.1 hypothetical protein GCL57_09920 [Fluviispira multicolorata]